MFASLSINAIVQDLLRLLDETLPKTIAVTTDLKEDVPLIRGDATQVHQVLLNLCVNARDAMPSGGALSIATSTVSRAAVVSEFPRAAASEYVLVKVTDTGSGMDEQMQRRIFEPFYTTKEPAKGTGLGLALVHSIMETHRGMIGVDTAPARGTVFRLYFPVEASAIEPPEPAGRQSAEPLGGTETILLIEDEEMLAETVREPLQARGYTVLCAADGEAGVAAFSSHRDDTAAVLTDFGLPKLSGEEVVRRIRMIDPRARIIVASGFVDPGTRSRLLQEGTLQIIQKPYLAGEMLAAIRTAIDSGRPRP